MGLINGVADDVARGYSAPLPVTRTSESKAKDAITGKELPASVVEISPEARARLAQDKAEPISQEQKDKNIKEIASLRSSLQGPTVNLGYALFNDPVTSWDARTFNPLLNMTATKTQDAMDDFAAALHDVLVDGQVGRNKYDNSDTSEAMALTLTQAKLHTLIEKYVSGNDQKQAKDIADEMISEKVAIREHVTLLGAQETLTLANQHGTREMQNSARDYLKQVESGTARPQIELSGMMEAMRSGSDMASVFSVFATLIRATPNSGNAAQPSIDGALNQLGVYQQQWQAFSEKYAS
ncbi:hypothetical protein [Atlantibacter sp.]|uniref:hypothetical protein n=1 Tax=Atlantibacter sp. TaxID=1903473 RepID=UPI00289D501A|nr:hypothetical protein [Atlantibacter sp.]